MAGTAPRPPPPHRHALVALVLACLMCGPAASAVGAVWPPASSSRFFPFDCSPHASNTTLLLAALADPPPPDAHALPAWVRAACPAVARHFRDFPLFHTFHAILPLSTTAYASAGVCTLQLVTDLAVAAGGPRPMLHAGAHLGALLHGGPIPWDDDVDALLPWAAREPFLAACAAARHAVHPSVSLICRVTDGAIKVYVRPRGGGNNTHLGWSAPFVDLFLYQLVDGRAGRRLVEVAASTGALSDNAWPARLAFPARPYFFAGLTVPGPPPALAHARYDTRACVSASWNHRQEDWVPEPVRGLRMDCCALAAAGFPFIVGIGGVRGDGGGGGDDDGRGGAFASSSLALVGGGGRALVVDHLGGRPKADTDVDVAALLASTVTVDAEAVPLVLAAPPLQRPSPSPRLVAAAAILAAAATLASLAACVAHVLPLRRRERVWTAVRGFVWSPVGAAERV